jgi:hypothetical protein
VLSLLYDHVLSLLYVQRRRNLKEADFADATDAEYHNPEHYIEVSASVSITTKVVCTMWLTASVTVCTTAADAVLMYMLPIRKHCATSQLTCSYCCTNSLQVQH